MPIDTLGRLLRHDSYRIWEDAWRWKERHVFLFPDKILLTRRRRDAPEAEDRYFYRAMINVLDLAVKGEE